MNWLEILDKKYTNVNWHSDREVNCRSVCEIKYKIYRSRWYEIDKPFRGRIPLASESLTITQYYWRSDWTIEVEEYGRPTQLPIITYNEHGLTCCRGADTSIFIPWDNIKHITNLK